MKIKILIYSFIVSFIVLIQSTVLEYIRFYDVKPNLPVVLIISVALLRGNVEGAVIGIICGFIQDITAGKAIGIYSLLGLYLGLGVGSVNKRLYRENIFVAVFFTFVSSILYELGAYSLNLFLKGDGNFLFAFNSVILPEAVYNSASSIFIYILIVVINDKFDNISKASRKY